MRNPSHFKHILQGLAGIFILVGLISPSLALAQSVTPPPPPPAERRELSPLNPNSGTGTALEPKSVLTQILPWSRLAFQSYRDGNWEIYAGNDDGSNLARLTKNAAADMQPKINRGATKIAFSSKRDGNYEIYTINMDGTGLTRLTRNSTDDVGPAWSPDGKKIAFQAYRDGQPEVYVMNADGTGQTRLTSNPVYDGEPAWSPDGSRIAYIASSQNYYYYFLMTMNSDGSNKAALTYYSYTGDPTWSPDGSMITIDADTNDDGWLELVVVNANSGYRQQIDAAPYNCDDRSGSWSPDGRYLAYTVICYIYANNGWYWTDGHIEIWDSKNPMNAAIWPVAGFTEFYPDWQSADAAAPVSSMNALPDPSPSPIALHWEGTDTGGSGIKSYEVQYKDGAAGSWLPLVTDTLTTDYSFAGISGHTYYFRVKARDDAANAEAWPADYDAVTTVESLPPVSAVHMLPAYVPGLVNFTLSWGGSDPGGSGIKTYDIQLRQGAEGTWTNWWMSTELTSVEFQGTPGWTYYFRSRATDRAGNIEEWRAGDGDTHSTFYSWQLSGVVHDNAGAPVSGAQLSLNPAPINAPPSNIIGNFLAFGLSYAGPYTTNWTKSGYGSLPPTIYPSASNGVADITLPPVDDIIRDGGFESGSLLPENWQTSGTLPATAATSAYHTGLSAAQLGDFLPEEWGASEKVSDLNNFNGGYVSTPRLVFDSAGTAHAVWVNGIDPTVNRVYYASKPAGGAWSVPVSLSSTGVDGAADIAVDSADTLYVAWSGAGAAYRSKPKDGDWSEPAVAMPGTFQHLYIGVDLPGSLHLLGDNPTGLVYTSMTGGVWAAPTIIDPLGFSPSLVVDAAGTAHALWAVGKYDQLVFYASRPKGGEWSAITQVSPVAASYSVDLAVDGTGTLYAVWAGYNKINFSMKRPGENWSAPEFLPTGTDLYYFPTVQVYHGRIGVSYCAYDLSHGFRPYFIEKASGSDWSQPVMMGEADHATEYQPELAAGPDGRFSVIWKDSTTSSDLKILFRQRVGTPQSGDATLTQSVTIPDSLSTPTLAFYYQLHTGSTAAGAGLSVSLLTDAGEVSLLSSQDTTPGWTFQTFDLSNWSGQTVSLVFRLRKAAWGLPTWARIDDVSLGSAHPDAWVSAGGVSGKPGQSVTFNIACGNRGGATAAQAGLSVTLPAGLTFVSSEPAPLDPAAAVLTWDLGDLAAKSSACSISLTATIDPSVTIPHTLAADVEVTTDSTEIEVENNAVHPAVDVPYYLAFVPAVKK